jgi:hypothetical protein
MNRFEITLGLLSIVGTVAIIAAIGVGEPQRMALESRGWAVRHVETGAQLYDQYCASCHGVNGSGGMCPPVDQTSGLHGGDIGSGVAWRLEELGWDRQQPFEYVYSVVASGRAVSTRPDLYPGNRLADTSGVMSMPAWSEEYGGPLRPDQVRDITSYIVAFREALPEDATPRPRPTDAPPERPTLAATAVVTTTVAPPPESPAATLAP